MKTASRLVNALMDWVDKTKKGDFLGPPALRIYLAPIITMDDWHALPESTLTVPWEWRTGLIEGAQAHEDMVKTLLKKPGNYSWLTEAGSIAIVTNGGEFAATCFIMQLRLLFSGAGRYSGPDYWIAHHADGVQLSHRARCQQVVAFGCTPWYG